MKFSRRQAWLCLLTLWWGAWGSHVQRGCWTNRPQLSKLAGCPGFVCGTATAARAAASLWAETCVPIGAAPRDSPWTTQRTRCFMMMLVCRRHSSKRQGPHQHRKSQLEVHGETPWHRAGNNRWGDACEQSCKIAHISCLQEWSRWYSHQVLDFRGVQCGLSKSKAKHSREDNPPLLLSQQPAHHSSLAHNTHFNPCAPAIRHKITSTPSRLLSQAVQARGSRHWPMWWEIPALPLSTGTPAANQEKSAQGNTWLSLNEEWTYERTTLFIENSQRGRKAAWPKLIISCRWFTCF